MKRTVINNFTVFEGIDGAGTTTQLDLLCLGLADRKIPHYRTSEPTDSTIGRLIRIMLRGEEQSQPSTLAMLFAADRNEHLYRPDGIVDHARKGDFVICDRYLFSSMAYQGLNCGEEYPRLLNRDFPLPGLVFRFIIDPDTSFSRIQARGVLDIFEHIEFQQNVTKAYDRVFSEFSESGVKIAIIDAARPIEELRSLIIQTFLEFHGIDR